MRSACVSLYLCSCFTAMRYEGCASTHKPTSLQCDIEGVAAVQHCNQLSKWLPDCVVQSVPFYPNDSGFDVRDRILFLSFV